MKELAPQVAPRWYMFAVLLNISKPAMVKISKSFNVHRNVYHSLSEVVEAWLEEVTYASSRPSEGEPSRYWLQVYHVVKRMGHGTFARSLDAKHSKPLQ